MRRSPEVAPEPTGKVTIQPPLAVQGATTSIWAGDLAMRETLPRSEIEDLAILSAETRCRNNNCVVFGTPDDHSGWVGPTGRLHRSHSQPTGGSASNLSASGRGLAWPQRTATAGLNPPAERLRSSATRWQRSRWLRRGRRRPDHVASSRRALRGSAGRTTRRIGGRESLPSTSPILGGTNTLS